MLRSRQLCRVLMLYWLLLPCAACAPALAQSAEATLSQMRARQMSGLIALDVFVTGASGKPVAQLEPSDFQLLDNGQPRRILSWQASDSVSEPPVEVLMVLDTLELSGKAVSAERLAVEGFLRQGDGHLAHRVTLFTLAETGLWQVAEGSKDGNDLARKVAHNDEVGLIRGFNGEAHGGSAIGEPPGLQALKALGAIATAERTKPGKKLLIWVGPGAGIGSSAREITSSPKDVNFYTICWFSTLLREARITLDSLAVGEPDPHAHPPLPTPLATLSAQDASLVKLSRSVLAIQSGGHALDASHDAVETIANCVHESDAYYTISFNPSPATHADEYHAVSVQIDQPGSIARAAAGYYDQPYYQDLPEPGIRQVNLAQFRQLLSVVHGDAAVAKLISSLQLTERLSSQELASLTAAMPGKKTAAALQTLSDLSSIAPPAAAEIGADAPPNPEGQQQIIARTAGYLKDTIPRLPNFFAVRTTVHYEEAAQPSGAGGQVDYQPLRVKASLKEKVLYRNGYEIANAGEGKRNKRKSKDPYLITYGTFGPALGFVRDAIATPGTLRWSRWEQTAHGKSAVFRYAIPAGQSLYQVAGCCLPDGEGDTGFDRLAGYHGEVTIDPATGAILRLVAAADLSGFVPADNSEITIIYGPVLIGGKVFICPVRSVSIMRMRAVFTLACWDESFRAYGSYLTMMNDIRYDDYHVFRGEARLLPAETTAP